MVDTTFRNINKSFVLSVKNVGNDHKRDSSTSIKEFNASTDNKRFLDQPVKNKQETYEKLVKESKNDDYTKRNLLDFL